MAKFANYLRTNSGSDEIDIQIDDPRVEINIRRRWMGAGVKRYKLECRCHPLSDAFGLFIVERILLATGDESPFETLTIDEEEVLLPLVIEYVTVSTSPVYVHDASQFVVMQELGYATWNDSFQLVLMVHDFDGKVTAEPLSDICDAIDKKKFAAGADEIAG